MLGLHLHSMIFRVFSNLNGSPILWQRGDDGGCASWVLNVMSGHLQGLVLSLAFLAVISHEL